MATNLVVRGAAGTTTNPDQRQRLIEYQAANKTALTLPADGNAQLLRAPQHASAPPPQTGIVDGEAAFTTTLVAQRIVGERRNYAPQTRQNQRTAPSTRIRDFFV